MKVYNLRCAQEHHFEGWFASEQAFLSQQERRLVACPVCGGTEVQRLPSAPRLNLSRASSSAEAPRHEEGGGKEAALQKLQALALQAVRAVLDNTEDVGERFVEEARRIHYDEAPARSIRGQATPEQARELTEEGIEVMPLAIPAALKGPVQ